jgi:hypothetical protein
MTGVVMERLIMRGQCRHDMKALEIPIGKEAS